MTNYVLSIDPGLSTGIALLSYEDDSPAELVEGWQFGGGVAGLLGWLKRHYREGWYDSEWGNEYAPKIIPSGRIFGNGLILEDEVDSDVYDEETDDYVEKIRNPKQVTIITEKFTARNTRGFSYTTASLEPLRGEGALIALGLMPDYTVAEKRWRDPALQYFSGGSGKAERKKKQHAFLKANGFYRTGGDFGTADADDFRSACAHGIAYIARELKHKPTFDMLAGNGEGN